MAADQGFTSNWESLRPAAPRFLTVFFYIFYVLFAIVLINLFIGIVTDAFPKVRCPLADLCSTMPSRALPATHARAIPGGVCDHQARRKSQDAWEHLITRMLEVGTRTCTPPQLCDRHCL